MYLWKIAKKFGQGPPAPSHLDKIQKNNSFYSWDRPIMHWFFWWNSFLLQSMGTIRRGWLKNDMMSRGRSGRVLDDYHYHYLELSSFCLSHLNIMHFDLFAQRDFELPHFWSCSISGLARLFHIYPQNRANGYLDTCTYQFWNYLWSF